QTGDESVPGHGLGSDLVDAQFREDGAEQLGGGSGHLAVLADVAEGGLVVDRDPDVALFPQAVQGHGVLGAGAGSQGGAQGDRGQSDSSGAEEAAAVQVLVIGHGVAPVRERWRRRGAATLGWGVGGFEGVGPRGGGCRGSGRGAASAGRGRGCPAGGGTPPPVRYMTGVKSRAPRNAGRGGGAENGAPQVFSTLLNTMKMFDRGNGVMLPPDPCMQLQSNMIALPAGPVSTSMPCFSARMVRLFWSGTPISCFFRDSR